MADPICGNCGKQLSQHHMEDEVFCFLHTNGDVFTDIPSDDTILNMILEDDPDIYDKYVARWQKENGHL